MKVYHSKTLETVNENIYIIPFPNEALALWIDSSDGTHLDTKTTPLRSIKTLELNEIEDFSEYKDLTVQNIFIEVLRYASNTST